MLKDRGHNDGDVALDSGDPLDRLKIAAIEATENAVVITDREGKIVWVNDAFEVLTGYMRMEAVGQSIRLLNSGRHSASFHKKLWETILSGEKWHGRITNKRKDGRLYDEDMTIAPLRNREGEIAHFVAVKRDITAQVGEEELSSKLAQAVQSSPDGIGITDAAGEITFVNEALLKVTGRQRAEVIGRHFAAILSRDNPASVSEEIDREGLASGWNGDCLVRRHEGADLAVSLNVRPIKDEDGHITGMFGIARDISERKKAEESLRGSEEKFRELAEHIRVVFFVSTPEPFTVTYISPAYEQIWGRSRQELYDRPTAWLESVLPEDRERVIALLQDSQRGTEVKMDYRIERPDGRVRWISNNTYPVRNPAGELLRMVGIAEDVTERKEREDALQHSEEQFRQMADNIREILFILTPNPPQMAFISSAYETVTGRSCQEVYDRASAWLDSVHPDDRERVGQGFGRSLQGVQVNLDFRVLRPDNTIRWIESRSFPVCDAAGKFVRVVGIAENVTERREKDEALRTSEEQFRQLTDNIHELFFVLVPEPFQVTYLSPAYDQIWGRSRQDVYDRPMAWIDSIYPEDRGVIGDILAQRRVQEELTFRIVRPNGAIRWIAVRSFPVWDEKGKLTRAVGIAEDITVRRQREDALLETHEKLNAAMERMREQTQEGANLSELVDILQSCQSVEEAYKITENVLQGMLPSAAGALCITSPSRDVVEMVAGWGSSLGTERVFRPDDCWALRRGKVHWVKDPNSPLRCKHVSKSLANGYVCVPLAAQGETLGVLFAEGAAQAKGSALESESEQTEPLARQAAAAGERISLAMANLRLREVLRGQSIRDALTGLFNRRFMEESLERELRRAARGKHQLALLMLDIDHFKKFNDTFGHQAGDALLRALGNLLKESTRGQDVVCRYGGEEFAFVLAGASAHAGRKRAELLREDVKQLNVRHGGQLLGAVTLSVGIAVFPENGETSQQLLKAADDALYRAKNEGRDRLVVA